MPPLPISVCKQLLFVPLFFFIFSFGLSAEPIFKENKGQWPNHVLFVANIPSGNIFFERNGFKFEFYENPLFVHPTQMGSDYSSLPKHSSSNYHVYFQEFVGSNPYVEVIGSLPGNGYYNYFLGNNPDHWATEVKAYHRITYFNLYPKIDLRVYTKLGKIKYEFVVHPGGNPNDILMHYQGVDELFLEDDALMVNLSFAWVKEHKPVSWIEKNGEKEKVSTSFLISEDKVTFKLNKDFPLEDKFILDPFLSFSTFSGSTSDNFGFTATYDEDEFLYGAGIVFGAAGTYPTTIGAFQNTFGGGTIDIAITKFNQDGSGLVYSTYIGGSLNEAPHSLVTDTENNLYILATTGSSNFPTTVNAYQTIFQGGPNVPFQFGFGFSHPEGLDLAVIKLNPAGTALLGSTLLGGTGNDGINNAQQLNYNYGDQFRGEIILTSTGNVVVGTVTGSPDFPTTTGAPQTLYGGGLTDGIVFSLNNTLTELQFSTFFGGNAADAIYSVQESENNGFIYAAGGTLSASLNFGNSAGLTPNAPGGVDGFVIALNTLSNVLVYGTYIGTNTYDQVYFVETDIFGDVYILGQSIGNIPIVGQVYHNPNSGQFIQKLTPTLDSIIWSSRVGRGNAGHVDISPTAFLVNVCGQIYMAGWGGSTNNSFATPTQSSTAGLPVTADAFQSTTDGNDFYLALYSPNMQELSYATFIGGPISAEHADGGTSRFDKKGNVYQALCGGCGNNNDFPTTPGAWSSTNQSNNCNMAVLKFSIEVIIPSFSIFDGIPLCVGQDIPFENNSIGGNVFLWEFGDGNFSTEFEPIHIYQAPGEYLITLIVLDSLGCSPPDTSFATLSILPPQNPNLPRNFMVCIGDELQINLPNNFDFEFFPEGSIFQDNGQASFIPIQGVDYFFESTDENGCIFSDFFEFDFREPSPPPLPNELIFNVFENPIIDLSQTDFLSLFWRPENLFSCSECFTTRLLFESEELVELIYTNIFGCTDTLRFLVRFDSDPFIPNAFTPNGDGINDLFRPILADYNKFHLIIFDRWGNKVFETRNPGVVWDGTGVNGNPSPAGMYNYILNFVNIRNEERVISGSVTLIR
ncbi:MAG: DUF7948 domain-containing protein [Luteibaculaceae bacterium]